MMTAAGMTWRRPEAKNVYPDQLGASLLRTSFLALAEDIFSTSETGGVRPSPDQIIGVDFHVYS